MVLAAPRVQTSPKSFLDLHLYGLRLVAWVLEMTAYNSLPMLQVVPFQKLLSSHSASGSTLLASAIAGGASMNLISHCRLGCRSTCFDTSCGFLHQRKKFCNSSMGPLPLLLRGCQQFLQKDFKVFGARWLVVGFD